MTHLITKFSRPLPFSQVEPASTAVTIWKRLAIAKKDKPAPADARKAVYGSRLSITCAVLRAGHRPGELSQIAAHPDMAATTINIMRSVPANTGVRRPVPMPSPPLPTAAHPEISAGNPEEARPGRHDLNIHQRRRRRLGHHDFRRFRRFHHHRGRGVPVSHFFTHNAPGHQQRCTGY
jgi:hypothetical protein